MTRKSLSLNTRVIHHGIPENSYGAVVQPMVLSTTFERAADGTFPEGRDIYTRASNPNRAALEARLADMEGGGQAAAFSSGQAATMSIFHALGSGAHIILPDDIYYGTKVLIGQLYNDWGLSSTAVDMTQPEEIKKAIRRETKLIWIETPSNPALKITDLAKVAEIARAYNLLTACDNTWATPYFTQPFDFGIDLVMHSTTKYISGHSDILGGCVIASGETPEGLFAKIRNFQTLGGAVPSSFDSWLMIRSMSTFCVRMPVHASNALALASYLDRHTEVEKVFYPGLPSDPYHHIAAGQMKNGFGGMLSILVKGDEKRTLEVASALRVFRHATSLGGVESLVDHRRTAEGSHSVSLPNLLRISVGIESIEDLIEDFKQALA